MSVARWFNILIIFLGFHAGAATSIGIKGYQEWKLEKVQVVMAQGVIVRAQLIKAVAESNRKQIDILERQLGQLNWNTEVARDLSVTDYFVLYLSQQPQNDRFHQAAQKMSTKEVAELIEAYANTLGTATVDSVVRPAPKGALPTKLPMQAIQAK